MLEKTWNNKIQSVAQHSMRVENLSEALSESERVILRIKSEQNENIWWKMKKLSLRNFATLRNYWIH